MLNKMAEKHIEKKTAKLEEEEEHKALVAYLQSHGHDRVHSQILLAPGQVLMSKSKNYFAVVEATGDFSIYVSSHFCKENKIWSTKTEGKGQPPYQLGVQNDGDIVLYDGKMTPLWKLPLAPHVNRGKGPYVLFMDDDGNLVFFDANVNQVWESGTARGHH